MKRKDLVKQLAAEGCVLLRPGSRHDVYFNPKNGMKPPFELVLIKQLDIKSLKRLLLILLKVITI